MFGNLFKEEEENTGTSSKPGLTIIDPKINLAVTRVDGELIEEPPKYRNAVKLVGIKNQGATCYLNALLQTLCFTPEFREGLFNLTKEELGYTDDSSNASLKARKIPLQLRLLFARLLFLQQDSCSTKDLTDSFGWQNSEQLEQHDVQELSRILFDAIENSLVGTSGDKLIHDVFKGKVVNQIQCCQCNRVSEREEEFLDLTVSVTGFAALHNSMSNMFQHTETMSGTNQYFCEQCKKLVNAQKGARLKTLPPVLTLSLLRFNYDRRTFSRYKEMGHFAFPYHLNMLPYMASTSNADAQSCAQYSLYSVIIHSGNAHRGHYQAHIRDLDGLGHSDIPIQDMDYCPDFSAYDKPYCKLEPKVSFDTSKKTSESPQDIMLQIIAKHESVKLDELGQMFIEKTGSSWNKKFRKHYGSMSKFIHSCSDLFVFDENLKTVKVCDVYSNEKARIDPAGASDVQDTCGTNNVDKELTKDVANIQEKVITCEQELSSLNMESSQETNTNDIFGNGNIAESDKSCGVHWFNFNDESVKAIPVSDIPHEFSGQRSAYMLFYRRNDLTRSEAAKCLDNVPSHIKEIMKKENDLLNAWRSEYQEAANRLDLHIYVEGMFSLSQGILKSIQPDGYVIHMNQRCLVADLLMEAQQNAHNMVKKGKRKTLHQHDQTKPNTSNVALSHLNIMEILPHGGIHLYDDVSMCPNLSLHEAGIKSKMNLLLWDGNSVLNKEILPGKDSEPIYLSITCRIDSTIACKLSFCTSRKQCLELTWLYASKLLHATPDFIRLKRLTFKNDGGDGENNIEIDNESELDINWNFEESFFACVDKMNALETNPEQLVNAGGDWEDTDSDVAADSTIIHIRNTVMVHEQDPVIRRAVYDFRIEQTMTVAALKVLICDRLNVCGIQSFDEYRLSYFSGDSCLPFYPHDAISSLSLPQEHIIVLEVGKAPGIDEIMVFLKLPEKLKCIELMLSKCFTLAQVFTFIKDEINLTGDEWHLRKCNCYGDSISVLDDLDLSVVDASICHGDYISVIPGKLPGKGNMRLCVWLYPKDLTLTEFCATCDVLSLLSNENTHLDSSENISSNMSLKEKPLVLGYVEVKKEDTVEDLERIIKKLDADNVKIPKKFCIRVIEKQVLTKILPSLGVNSATLKRLKVQSSTQLGIQPFEREVSKVDIFVNVSFHIPTTRCYTSAMEFMCARDSTKLTSKLAACIRIPTENILVAKRGSDALSTWSILQSDDSSKVKNKSNKIQKKNRKGSARKKVSKENIVELREGDVVRVKIISEEEKQNHCFIKLEDFDTENEILLKKKNQDNSNNSQKNPSVSYNTDSKTSGTKISGEKKKSNKETALKIHVENFAAPTSNSLK